MFTLLKIIFTTLLTFAYANSISASDAALKRIMGFSPDGKYFAFEQYGIQDGSGFPYVDIFFIDTQNNSWVADTTPIHILIKDENTSLAKARAIAIAKATPFVKQLNTVLHGFTLVSNPITQLDSKKYSARFGTHPSAPTLNQFELKLTTQNANSTKCSQYSADTKIFSLSLTSLPTKSLVQNYTDSNLPSSRGCPIDYSISDVHYFEATNGDVIFMTFINIMAYGFEGTDRRFMVIPFYVKK